MRSPSTESALLTEEQNKSTGTCAHKGARWLMRVSSAGNERLRYKVEAHITICLNWHPASSCPSGECLKVATVTEGGGAWARRSDATCILHRASGSQQRATRALALLRSPLRRFCSRLRARSCAAVPPLSPSSAHYLKFFQVLYGYTHKPL